jgi:hypothetical protein
MARHNDVKLEEMLSVEVPNCTSTTSYVTMVPANCKDKNITQNSQLIGGSEREKEKY